jgi:hypothetical protein
MVKDNAYISKCTKNNIKLEGHVHVNALKYKIISKYRLKSIDQRVGREREC